MGKALFTMLGLALLVVTLQGQTKTNVEIFNESQRDRWDAEARSRQLDIEERKVALEERRLYLATLERSQISEEKARSISVWVLQNLKDYPQGKKAKHLEEDIKLLIETISTLAKWDITPQVSK